MTRTRTSALVLAMATALALPAAALGSNSHAGEHGQAGQHGNHCGLGHVKHVKGSGGTKVGQTCGKAHHGTEATDETDDGTEVEGTDAD